jgi:peptidyl-prolyl cis-trans isomerase SurA
MKLPTCLLFSASLLLAPALPAEIVERVIARVNGDIVTLSEFEQRQVAALQAARVGPDGAERYLRDNNQRILQEAIDELLVLQRAGELGIKVRPEYIDEVLEGIKKDNGITSDEQFREQLRREGLSLDELKRSVTRSILKRQVLARELEPRAAVTDAEVAAEYEKNRAAWQRPASVTLREILVSGPDARERAEELARQARAGEDFAALARAHSTSPSAQSGGELGRIARGELARDLEEAAFALPVGGISDPIASGGWRLLKVEQKTEAGLASFEDARRELTERLRQERMAAEYQKYITGLRAAAVTIDVRVREVPLEVQLPAGSLAPVSSPPGTPATPAPAQSEDEFSTTGTAQPERVAPPAVERQDEPTPQPTPPPR